ncbi:MAG TPA: lactonase family protein [Gemmataceae bacterium]|nr:lactonase family protein [Gemmataceae bacterium]
MATAIRLGTLCFVVVGALMSTSFSAFSPASAAGDDAKPSKFWVFVGTYSGGPSKGIYRCEFDAATGKLSDVTLAAETHNPSFLALHPTQPFLYAVGEHSDIGRMRTGSLSAYHLDTKTGSLTPANQPQSSGGAGPCFVAIDHTGKAALVANYSAGSVAVLPISDDGKLGMATTVIQHEGSSADKQRQGEPHAHSINVDKANRFAFAADLGCDKIFVYRLDPLKGTLTPNDPPSVALPPGSGPRHFAFHPSGKFAYAINEIALTIAMFAYDAERGVLEPKQTISTLPPDAKGPDFSTAEVVVHSSGKFVYGSNRGHNSITVFAVDEATGKLSYVQNQAEGIKTPRNFNIDPTGQYLLVANQDGDSVIVFKIDTRSGKLTPTGISVDVPKPVCVKFVPVGA